MKKENESAVTAVIIEDVAAARENLAGMLETYCPEIRLVGSAESVVEGLKLITQNQPDILFLDIELGEETAFDLLDILPDHQSQVIFTTGSQEYALKAFRYAAIDYLLKPIDPDELVEAVAKHYREKGPSKEQLQLLTGKANTGKVPSRIALKTLESIYIIDIPDIQRCEADGNYTKFFIDGRAPILVTKTLKEYDKLLEPAGFLRVHQSHLVNFSRVSEFVKIDGGYLVMKDGAKVPVSTRRVSTVREALERLS